jgi:molybdate transport system substrate-binding protein
MISLFEKLELTKEVKPKLRQTPTGVFVGTIIANGEVEIGFQQISELSQFAGVDFVGPLPDQVQLFTRFASGIVVGAKEAEAAQALVKFLAAPAAAAAYTKRGLEPW